MRQNFIHHIPKAKDPSVQSYFLLFQWWEKNLNYKRLKKRTRIYVANYSLALNRKCCVFRLLIIKEKWLFEAETVTAFGSLQQGSPTVDIQNSIEQLYSCFVRIMRLLYRTSQRCFISRCVVIIDWWHGLCKMQCIVLMKVKWCYVARGFPVTEFNYSYWILVAKRQSRQDLAPVFNRKSGIKWTRIDFYFSLLLNKKWKEELIKEIEIKTTY